MNFTVEGVVLFIVFVILNIVDAILTYYIIMQGGREKAPVADWFMRKFGVARGLVLLKVIFTAAIFYPWFLCAWYLNAAAAVVMVWVVYHNGNEVHKMGGGGG